MQRRKIRFSSLHEALEDARSLQSTGYEQVGNWNLEQIVDHLVKTFPITVEQANFGIPRLVRPILKWFLFGKVRRGEWLSMQATAPPQLVPDDNIELDERLKEFEHWANLLESDETEFVPLHPVFGKINREEWLTMQRWHAAHHLSFLIPQS